MSSLLSVSNTSNEYEEFSLKDIEVLVDSDGENWFKRAHIIRYLGLAKILKSVEGLDTQEMPQRDDIKAMVSNLYPWSGPKDHQNKTDKFLSFFGVMYVIVNTKKDKGKALKEHILKDIVPRRFDAKIEEIKGKHQHSIEEKDPTIALLNDDLKNHEYENVGLQGEIRAKDQQIATLQRRYVGYLSDEFKNNGISIIANNNEEEEYPYISICGQHGYRRHKVRVMLTLN